MKLMVGDREFDVQVEEGAVTVDGTRYHVALKGDGHTRTVTVNGRAVWVRLEGPDDSDVRPVNVDGKVWSVKTGVGTAAHTPPRPGGPAPARGRPARPSRGAVTAQMTGRVLRILAVEGERIDEGAPLLILEAMKMENEIRAPRAGTVQSILVNVGDRVNAGDTLIVLEDEP
jgi:biotin carboxyl carrier protein